MPNGTMLLLRPLAAAILFATLFGCQKPGPDSPGTSAKPLVNVKVGDEKDLAGLIRRHKGKVVLVDFWATWCVECKKLFPHTVKLHETLVDKGLAVISVSMDDPVDKPDVLDFLTRQRAVFPNLLNRHGAGSKGFKAFDIPGGALPHFRLYDRAGKLGHVFPAQAGTNVVPEDIDVAVHKLLAEK